MRSKKTHQSGQLPLLLILFFITVLFLFSSILPILQKPACADQNSLPQQQTEYFLGVFPFLPASRLEGVFAPIAAEISKKTGKRIHYRSGSDFSKFTDKIARQEFDIAFIQPFDYVGIAEQAGYIPIAKRREPLSAIFVAKEESLLAGLSDLRGKTVAMAPKEAALSYIGKAALLEAGLSPGEDVTIEHMHGHHSCLQQVLIGKASAYVTGRPALRVFQNKMAVKLKVLSETKKFPAMLFVVHPRVAESDRKLIEETLLNTTLSGVEADLRTLLIKDDKPPFMSIAKEDYAIIRDFWQQMQRN